MMNGNCLFCLDKYKLALLNKCVMCPKHYHNITYCDFCFDIHTKKHIQKTEEFFNERYTKDDIIKSYKLNKGNCSGLF